MAIYRGEGGAQEAEAAPGDTEFAGGIIVEGDIVSKGKITAEEGFYGDGSNITNLPNDNIWINDGATIRYEGNGSAATQVWAENNGKKASMTIKSNGLTYFTGDAATYFGTEADEVVKIIANGTAQFAVSSLSINAFQPLTAPSFIGDGSALTNLPNDNVWKDNGKSIKFDGDGSSSSEVYTENDGKLAKVIQYGTGESYFNGEGLTTFGNTTEKNVVISRNRVEKIEVAENETRFATNIVVDGKVFGDGSEITNIDADLNNLAPEAPEDGETYARNNKTWISISDTAGIPDAPVDGIQYGRQDGTWTATIDAYTKAESNATNNAQNTNISTNAGNISSNTTAIGTLSGQVAQNSEDIAELQDSIFFTSAYSANYPSAANRDPEDGNMYLQAFALFTYSYASATQIFCSKTDEAGNVRQFTAIKTGDSIVLNEVDSPNYGRYELVSIEEVSESYVVMNVIPKLGEGTIVAGVKVAFQAFPKVGLWNENESNGYGTYPNNLEVNGGVDIGSAANGKLSNTMLGRNASGQNAGASAFNNVSVGDNAFCKMSGANDSVAVGSQAMKAMVSGDNNTAIGSKALSLSSNGQGNVAIGAFAGATLAGGDNNILIGHNAAPSAPTVSNEVTIGNNDTTTIRMGNGDILYPSSGGGGGTGDAYTKAESDSINDAQDVNISANTTAIEINTTDISTKIDEAPIDGKEYTRKDAGWTERTSDGVWTGVDGDAVFDGTIDVKTVDSYNDITIGPYGYNPAYGLKVGHGSGGYIDSEGRPVPIASNVAIGYDTLVGGTDGVNSGQNATAIGYGALRANLGGNNNTAVGYNSLQTNLNGQDNTAVGVTASLNNKTGNKNSSFGKAALLDNVDGHFNTAIGQEALYSNVGDSNTALGSRAGIYVTAGSNNTLLGYEAQASSSIVSNEITLGNADVTTVRMGNGDVIYPATDTGGGGGDSIWTEADGVATYNGTIDVESMNSVQDIIVGDYKTNAAYGINIGHGSGKYTANLAMGYQALGGSNTGSQNMALGYQALKYNTSGKNNLAVGYQSLGASSTGQDNTALGMQSSYGNWTGNYNSSFGKSSLLSNNEGDSNTAIGESALSSTKGDNNTALGAKAGDNITSGSNNIVIGYNANASSSTVSNEVTIGNDDITSTKLKGAVDINTSLTVNGQAFNIADLPSLPDVVLATDEVRVQRDGVDYKTTVDKL